MGSGNRSPFWEAMGRVFTGLPYTKADRLSVTNKEFIQSLFPHEPIYRALLPESVQQAIGAIHPAAQGAARLLRGIGFRPLSQVEPFDGGPYYSARRSQIRLIRRARRLRVATNVILAQARIKSPSDSRPRSSRGQAFRGNDGDNRSYLIGTEAGGSFRAALVRAARIQDGKIHLPREGLRSLKIRTGDPICVCPI